MGEEKELYNIVIIGGMNPRIHSPHWYRFVEVISEAELEEALLSPNTFTIPPMAQFQTSGITVLCQEERWEIKTEDKSKVERIVGIATKLFDDLLPHTPVSMAGYNFRYRRESSHEDVGAYLASVIENAPLGLFRDNSSAGEITHRRKFEDHTSFVTIKTSTLGGRWFQMHHNYEYAFEDPGPFKLADLFARRYEADRRDAGEQAARILEAINTPGKV